MPVYLYKCSKCGHDFETIEGFNSHTVIDCPLCKAESKRVLCPASIIFKGSGFYKTDGSSSTGKPKK